MTESESIDAIAAEFVLGTLDAADRVSVDARRQREPRLDAAIAEWERRLAPLMETVAPLRPRPDLFPEIEARIAARSTVSANSMQVLSLEQRARRWRTLAIAATTVAACLLLAIGVRESYRPGSPRSYVAVFQKDDATPAFLLSVDLDTRILSIRPVAAQAQPGKTYQLWIASAKLAGGPHSLGLLDDPNSVTRHILASYNSAVLENATFGISLEPEGGSPTGRPTGPAYHAKLIPTPR